MIYQLCFIMDILIVTSYFFRQQIGYNAMTVIGETKGVARIHFVTLPRS